VIGRMLVTSVRYLCHPAPNTSSNIFQFLILICLDSFIRSDMNMSQLRIDGESLALELDGVKERMRKA
jgi:hypothetical protein